MTEHRLRDLYTWLAAHRMSLIEHAGALAECAGWARSADMRNASAVLDRLAERLQTMAREHAAALETLDRVHPPPAPDFHDEDEDTIPHCLRDLIK